MVISLVFNELFFILIFIDLMRLLSFLWWYINKIICCDVGDDLDCLFVGRYVCGLLVGDIGMLSLVFVCM